MKASGKLIIGFILSALIVGALVMVCMPFIIKNASFLMGVITGLVVASLSFVILLVGKRRSYLKRLRGNQSTKDDTASTTDSQGYTWILASVLIVLMGIVAGFVVFKQNEVFKTKALYQRAYITQQSELIESNRIKGMVVLMENLLDKIDEELEEGPERVLSDETIGRIAALSYSFKPYTSFEGDTLSERKLSPERAQLLLALSNMNIDTSSLSKIMVQSQFAGADLREAELGGAYLRRADLNGADLRGANLKGADLSEADLRTTDLWGAHLQKAELTSANLKRANLGWADMNGANLKGANLNGADMASVKLRTADLSGALIQWADLNGAFLDGANMIGADLYGTNLLRANLTAVNLSEANLTAVNLSDANLKEANLRAVKLRLSNLSSANLSGVNLSSASLLEAELTGAELTGVIISDENWFNMLNEWLVIGAKDIQEKYKIEVENSDDQIRYRLEKI